MVSIFRAFCPLVGFRLAPSPHYNDHVYTATPKASQIAISIPTRIQHTG
jgi:hypothetical protein